MNSTRPSIGKATGPGSSHSGTRYETTPNTRSRRSRCRPPAEHLPGVQGMPRLGLVHSPDGGAYLSMLADLADDRKLSGAHVTIYRHPRRKVGARRIIGRAQIED